MNKLDDAVLVEKIYKTTNYAQFKDLPGNRKVDPKHVQQLVRTIKENGNLTQQFPVIVNAAKEVFDGQHTIKALEILRQPVYYTIKEGLNVDMVPQANSSHKNWDWKDYSNGLAERGNVHYKHLLDLHTQFKDRYGILMMYVGATEFLGRRDRGASAFRKGEMEIPNLKLTTELLTQYHELRDITHDRSSAFAVAVYRFMRTPQYNHERMLQNVEAYGEPLSKCYIVPDYLFALEDIYKA